MSNLTDRVPRKEIRDVRDSVRQPDLCRSHGVPESHTATGEWQSFESRMRRRRLDRCLARAKSGLESNTLVAAEQAIEEAEWLDPSDETVKQLAAQIKAAVLAALPLPLPVDEVRPTQVLHVPDVELPAAVHVTDARPSRAVREKPPQSVHEAVGGKSGARRSWLAAAAALVLLSGAAGWLWTRTNIIAGTDTPTVPVVEQRHPVVISRAGESALARVETLADASTTLQRVDIEPPPSGTEDASTTGLAARDEIPRVGPNDRTTPAISASAATDTERAVARADTDSRPLPVVAATSALPDLPTIVDEPRDASFTSNTATTPPTQVRDVDKPASELIGTVPVIDGARLLAPVGEAVGPNARAIATSGVLSEQRAVEMTLSRYETAYSRLDVQAVREVWPSVDRTALARAFDGLQSQSVQLGDCQVRVNGTSARADCAGRAQWSPKVGGGQQTAARRWNFELKNNQSEWVIVSANTR